MEIQETIGNESMPTTLKDPFKKNCVKRIYVNYSESLLFSKEWKAFGVVEFSSGNTKGEQRFEGKSFDEVVVLIKNFITKELQ
jgi:hypothetical protein